MTGIPRALLDNWPGRIRFPGVLIALAEHGRSGGGSRGDGAVPHDEPAELDGDLLAGAVLGHVGGVSSRAAFDALLEQGEHDAAEQVLAGEPQPDGHQAELLTRKLEEARAAEAVSVRQRVDELERRAKTAGIAFERPDVTSLIERSRSRRAAAGAVLTALEREVEDRIRSFAEQLDRIVTEQERAVAGSPAPADQHAGEDASAARVRALLRSGELVAAQALLNREPLGAPVPEALAPLPEWDEAWTTENLMEYHLNPTARRPPEVAVWKAADESAERLLLAFDRLNRESSPEAAVGLANALGRFLGGPGEGAVANRIEGGYFTFFDGLFSEEPLSGLHPTGRIDLYVADPETFTPPQELAAHGRPHVAVGRNLLTTGYSDRAATAVLSLCDLLRLAVLKTDRGARTLGLLARQWSVDALVGDSPAALGRILGASPEGAWRTLRWITHLSLGGGTPTVQAMEHCTGMDPGLLRTMLRYAETAIDRSAHTELWAAESGGWRKDPALLHALRSELLALCGGPAARAAWWAALSICDEEDGLLTAADLGEWAEICSGWAGAGPEVLRGTAALLERGLLAASGEDLRVPLSGAVRALRPSAETELGALLEEMERTGSVGGTDEAGTAAAPSVPVADRAWTVWHRNRFAPVPACAGRLEAEQRGAGPGELAALAELAAEQLRASSAEELIERAAPAVADLGAVLPELTAQCRLQYPGLHVDLRCPPSLLVDVPAPVMRAVLYEVLDNAAEALDGRDTGLVQVSVSQEGPEAIVEVEDNGPGLPAEARGRRVFQAGWTTRGADRGWGLHRVRKLLQALPASAVEAEVEVFSSFHPALTGAALRLVLPVTPAAADGPEHGATP
ncbi:ATP-binding protein [Kitasatospora sp. MBT63]|uniref:ATP-binding protein n=1 Tax=Kitasatospora sp. MBT63 TaxID=1444768 RepID=UPI000539F46C|nr:ATP-binding protein [Kitasatospora sp. MBT63]